MSEAAPVWLAPLLGGCALTAMSASSSYFMKEEAPNVKTISRDFILGAILVLFIMQLVPESVAKLMMIVMSVVSFKMSSIKVGGGSEPAPSEEIEVRVGVPRF